MHNDDPQHSPERLNKTASERNHYSFLGWLRRRGEETEEERIRKMLDIELKKASRQRAEQFEEERRVQEKREVAETKKLKKRWRAKLVEKSKKLIDEISRYSSEPLSGYEIARVMVAERIIKLDDMLHDDTLDLRRSEIKALKTGIDFMGLLSEKLDRPELDVPAEIEQLYHTIATSVEEITEDTPPETPTEPVAITEQLPSAPSQSEKNTLPSDNDFASSIIKAILRTVRTAEMTKHTAEHAEDSAPNAHPSKESTLTTKSKAKRNATPADERLISIVNNIALPKEDIRAQLSKNEQARRLAEVVERATMASYYTPKLSTDKAKETVGREKTKPRLAEASNPTQNKKIKYLSDPELIGLATKVDVGAGRLLSDVYIKGEIDRDGLVKVIEKFRKGLDYRDEFSRRRERIRLKNRATSEALTQSPSPQASLLQKATHRPFTFGRQALSSSLLRSTLPRIVNKKILSNQKLIEAKQASSKLIRDVKERLKRENQITILFVTVILVVVLIVATLELTTR